MSVSRPANLGTIILVFIFWCPQAAPLTYGAAFESTKRPSSTFRVRLLLLLLVVVVVALAINASKRRSHCCCCCCCCSCCCCCCCCCCYGCDWLKGCGDVILRHPHQQQQGRPQRVARHEKRGTRASLGHGVQPPDRRFFHRRVVVVVVRRCACLFYMGYLYPPLISSST